MKIALACRLFGHCRQAYYQSKADIEKEIIFNNRIIADVREIRLEDPRIGGYKLWLMLCAVYGKGNLPGRDKFFVLLRRYGLMLPPPKPRHTTNSNHRYHKWKNLIRGFEPLAANQLWVSDITYISLEGGECLLPASDNRRLFTQDSGMDACGHLTRCHQHTSLKNGDCRYGRRAFGRSDPSLRPWSAVLL